MSGKKVKAERKKSPKVEKPKGARVPNPNRARQRVTIAQLDNAFGNLIGRFLQLERKVESALKGVWSNEAELKRGLDAAEFNLRAHQKALNAMAVDINALQKAAHYHEENEVHPGAPLELQTTLIETPGSEEVPPSQVRRMDWGFYHAEVQKDLDRMEEARRIEEAERFEKEKGLIASAVEKLRAEVSQDALKALAGRIARGENILKDAEGKVLDLSQAGRMLAVETLQKEPEVKEEQEALPDQPSDVPEGAAVFGG